MILLPHRHLTSAPPLVRTPARQRSHSAPRLIPVSLLLFAICTGCNRLKPTPKTETIYVLAKQAFLRDRVAAVSNRVAEIHNGDKLELLERDRRFLKVKTTKGETGWIEEHQVVNPEVVTGFEQLQKTHEHDPLVATAVLRDDGYLHLKPGRDTDRYVLLPEGDKLQMLVRASVPKAVGPQASGATSSYAGKGATAPKKISKGKATREQAEKDKKAAKEPPAVRFSPKPPPPPSESLANPEGSDDDTASTQSATSTAPPPPPAMEDWWLVRDAQGRVGWMMARRIDVDVPDAVAGYAESQKMVAAYLLRKVSDPESSFPDGLAPEYVTVLNPYQDGLPYDFNQVRVFTWNVKKHRYETAYRQRNLQGYLPVIVTPQTESQTNPPTFQIRQGVGDSVSLDPDTGAAKPASIQVTTYVLEGDHVSKAGAEAPAAARPATAPASAKSDRKSGKRNARVKRRKLR